MERGWLVGANVLALGVWMLSWFVPVNIALPQAGVVPSRWNILLLAMQAHPWEAIIPAVLCLDAAVLARGLKRS